MDGQVRRTVSKESTLNPEDKTYKFPSRPSRIQLSIWDAGQIGSNWTDGWSGGKIDWSDAKRNFQMDFEWIKIDCLTPAKDAAWPPAGYGPTIDDTKTNTTNKAVQGTQGVVGGNKITTPASTTKSPSIIVPLALTGGLMGAMIIVGFAVSSIARRKKAAKLALAEKAMIEKP